MTPVYSLNGSLVGGGERSNFRFYAGHTSNTGAADNTSLKRYQGAFYINMLPTSWMTISSMLHMTRLDRGRNRSISERLGETRFIPDMTTPLSPNKDMYGQFLNEYDKVIDDNINSSLIGQIAVNFAILKNLNFSPRFSIDYNENKRNVFWPSTLMSGNHGGIDKEYGGATLEERKIPIILYNTNFVGKQFTFPPVTNAFRARSGINGTISGDAAGEYNIGTSGEYTVQLKLMVHQFGTNNAAIISKQNNTGNSDDGWSFIHNGVNGWRLKVKGAHVYAAGKVFDIGKWYTLTARIYMDGVTRKAQVFTDGELINDGEIGSAQGSSTANFNVGFSTSWSGGTWIQSVKDVVIYNTAIPIEYIQNNFCKNPVDETYRDNMIGNWSIGDGSGNKLRNSVVGAPDFTINGAYSWEFLQDDFCKILTGEEDNENQFLVNQYDILPQIFYWLHIETYDSWGLEGAVFLDRFEQEFIGK